MSKFKLHTIIRRPSAYHSAPRLRERFAPVLYSASYYVYSGSSGGLYLQGN